MLTPELLAEFTATLHQLDALRPIVTERKALLDTALQNAKQFALSVNHPSLNAIAMEVHNADVLFTRALTTADERLGRLLALAEEVGKPDERISEDANQTELPLNDDSRTSG